MDPYILALMQDGLDNVLAQDLVDGIGLMNDSMEDGLTQGNRMDGMYAFYLNRECLLVSIKHES